MSTELKLFPTLTDEMFEKIRYQASPYYFFYNRDGIEYELELESLDGSATMCKVSDKEGVWSPDDYDLILKRCYTFKTYSYLFGVDGIACRNAELGIAIMWTSVTSKQRGVIDVGTIINNGSDEVSFSVEYNFDIAQLRGNVEFKTIIYLKRSGNPTLSEEFLANTEGYVLGELDSLVIILDGNGSMFPIYEVNEPSQPLWYIHCNWEDPTYEMFAETVKININRAHPGYKFLDKKTYRDLLLNEIMASAVSIVINNIKESEYWSQTVSGENLQIGSVSQAIYYFISTLEWKLDSQESLSLSIRKFLDSRNVGEI